MDENYDLLFNFIKGIIPIRDTEAWEIAKAFRPLKINKGQLLLRENEISDDYVYLQKGLMRTFLYDLEGNEITTEIFTENNIVFEITSFFNRVRSDANIQAITDCSGFRLSYEELNRLFHNKPDFRDFGRAILVKCFIASNKRNYAMINQTAEQRYQHLLTSRPEILKYAPLKYIASYLGVTDSTLSRIRKKTQ
ncbi:Crp/Fnr family transcriptional regulator [Poritiphilus flavus]|uniref:Cyclic nucleotide-binding domain-containing protein n=1 Tax=Poritiphilus flavus TaxID=2697053 RepID=A0A6L9EGR1_9FLAO|nr:Crp/Fnr family transcriptional regulator [Poritiphilus flavus]NAS13873.1 cyclic nucleotide-binding domain-containing protein [Poritiphilus flavus]